jgi:hypothetical protein
VSFRNEGLIDELDWKIVEALQIDARLSMAALGRKIGLSAPATTERVRRLEERKVICGLSRRNRIRSSRNDEMLANSPWFQLWQRYGVCCRTEFSVLRLGESER